MKMQNIAWAGAALLAARLWRSRRGRTTDSHVQTRGRTKTASTRSLELGAAILQNRSPIEALNMYLDGFHSKCGDMNHQMEAHHYCSALNEDVIQCVIYDSNGPDAKLIGVEYIISERLFKDLPEDERKLWHSHHHEVKSGQLIAPGIPELAEHALMQKLVNTYGKTWHTWDTHQDNLPLGIPALMMGFTQDGQVRIELTEDRDHRFGISSADKRQRRVDIPAGEVVKGANSWESGHAPQLKLESQDFEASPWLQRKTEDRLIH